MFELHTSNKHTNVPNLSSTLQILQFFFQLTNSHLDHLQNKNDLTEVTV